MEEKHLKELAEKFINGQASAEEAAELHAWWDAETNREEEQIVVTSRPENRETVSSRMLAAINEQIDTDAIAERTDSEAIAAQIDPTEPIPTPTIRSPKTFRLRWLTAAAAILAIVLVSTLLLRSNHSPIDTIDVLSTAKTIQPGSNKAILELSTGRTVRLDSAGENIIYPTAKQANSDHNTVQTSAGSQYQLALSDGTKVWLNAASSLKFPTVFGKIRQVELSGEAYFEVATDAAHPFTILTSPTPGAPACKVTVLGTAFDINAYPDEPAIKTTLLQGSLLVADSTNHLWTLLKPGQEAVLGKELKVVDDSESENVIAWKDGLFKFKNDSIDEVMKQLARWYGVEIQYSGIIREHFVSTLSRNASLYEDLETLQKTGRVRFEMKGKTIVVLPY